MNSIDQRSHSFRNLTCPRKPQRRSSLERYEKLIDALETLISEREIEEINLSSICHVAGVPTPSAYHFFPCVDACLTALAERHYCALTSSLANYPQYPPRENWQSLLFQLFDQARTYYEVNSLAVKVHFGTQANCALRQLQIENHGHLADILLRGITREFELPPSRRWREKFLLAININDAFWTLSCSRSGCIREKFATEGKRAAFAYLKMYLGELLERRQFVE